MNNTSLAEISARDIIHYPNAIHLFIMITVTVLILLSSIFTLAVIFYSAGYKSLQGVFMICIAMANLLVGILVTPLGIYLSLHQEFYLSKKHKICAIPGMVLIWSITFVLYCIGYMALEKFFKIKLSINYVTRIRSAYGWIIACFTAVGCGIVAGIPIFRQKGYMYTSKSFLCAFNYKELFYISTPAIGLNCAAHLALGYLVHNIKKTLNQTCPSMPRRLNRDVKAARTILISLGIFICSYVPATVCIILRQNQVGPIPDQVFFVVSWLAISNNFFISILYYHHNSVFRHKARKLILGGLTPCQALCTNTTMFEGLWTVSEVNEHLSL